MTLPSPLLKVLRVVAFRLARASLDAASREAGTAEMRERLRALKPDIQDQYTSHFNVDSYRAFWEPKMRSLHAFQVKAVLDAIDAIGKDNLFIADIGDSSGSHAEYIKALAKPGQISHFVSVNLDPVAIEKVRRKGGEAILCRAEKLDLNGFRPNLFLSFQMVEHVLNPIGFIHGLATEGAADHLVISVPYVQHSRFGGRELRGNEANLPETMNAEGLHIFELSPIDWSRLFLFAGFRTIWTRVFTQYPSKGLLRVTAPVWRKADFDGFAVFFLRRDLSVAHRYVDWD